jgi:hypothetical protein
MKKETGRMSPPGLHWRVNAEESLGGGNEYQRELWMRMVVKFTH